MERLVVMLEGLVAMLEGLVAMLERLVAMLERLVATPYLSDNNKGCVIKSEKDPLTQPCVVAKIG